MYSRTHSTSFTLSDNSDLDLMEQKCSVTDGECTAWREHLSYMHQVQIFAEQKGDEGLLYVMMYCCMIFPLTVEDGRHKNSMIQNNKFISISISLTSCRESNNHHALVPTNTKFVQSCVIS